MDKRNIANVLIKIEDDATWDSLMEQSVGKLLVVDCHQEWCGCCESVHPSLNRILIEYDSIEERFIYATASISKVAAKISASLPAESKINLEKHGCLPLFAVYRHKECISVIIGVDSPVLLQQIAQNMPDKPIKE